MGVLYLETRSKMVRALMTGLMADFRATLPYLKPIRGILVAFCITGYLIYKIPISGKPGQTVTE